MVGTDRGDDDAEADADAADAAEDVDTVDAAEDAGAGDTAAADAEADASADGASQPDRPSSLLEALEVRRNARIGLAAGFAVAALVYVPTLVAVDFELVGPGGLFLGLALVLAVTVAGVVAAGLCVKTFLEPVLDRRAWLRRGGTAAIVGGLAWAALPAVAWLAAAAVVTTNRWRAFTGGAALSLAVGTAAIHAATRDGTAASQGSDSASAADSSPTTDPEPTADSSPAAGPEPIADSATTESPATASISPPWRRRIQRGAYWIVTIGLLLAAGNASGNPGPIAETEAGAIPSPFLTSAFLAAAAAVPFAATASLADVLPERRLHALQFGALLGTIGVAWLAIADGWAWLEATVAVPAAAALAVATVPSGLGWAIAGSGLRSVATRRVEPDRSSRDDDRRRDN